MINNISFGKLRGMDSFDNQKNFTFLLDNHGIHMAAAMTKTFDLIDRMSKDTDVFVSTSKGSDKFLDKDMPYINVTIYDNNHHEITSNKVYYGKYAAAPLLFENIGENFQRIYK